ncbi:MAG: hypothetical protein O9283_10660 [Sphingomonadaceae bacterium]|nr:hypothetical protein [Sphingomonadaceae bacterium]
MILRRVLLAGAAALATTAAGAANPSTLSSAAASRARFTPPTGPVMVSRTLIRALPDGKEVRTIRRYRVWFSPEGEGFRIDGELAEVKVEVPPILEGLAAIERTRTDPGLFPVRLDGMGRIQPGPAATGDGARVRAAALGQVMLNQATLAPPTRAQASAMLQQVSIAAAGQTAWPVDLFNPAEAERRERRALALPGGQQGSVEIVVTATGIDRGRLPGQVERLVVTELDGTRRTSREVWTFVPAD